MPPPPIAPEAQGCPAGPGQIKRLVRRVAAGLHERPATAFGILPPLITQTASTTQEPSAQRSRLHRRGPTIHGRRAHILQWQMANKREDKMPKHSPYRKMKRFECVVTYRDDGSKYVCIVQRW